MKRFRTMLAMILALALIISVVYITEAEQNAGDGEWQADLLKLMDSADVPKTTTVRYNNTYDEGVKVDAHETACEITVNGVTYGCEFAFDVMNGGIKDWDGVQTWLGRIVTESARSSGSDSESLAKAIDRAISSARKNPPTDESGNTPEWASPNIAVNMIRVSTPFYPELTVGKNGEATRRLQKYLIEMGFLEGSADGCFGEQTKSAVLALEYYVRDLEQALIDARPAPTVVPTVEPAAAPTAVPATAAPTQDSDHVLSLVLPTAVPDPTEVPTAAPTDAPVVRDVMLPAELEPVTPADGVADALLQAYLYSDSFCAVRKALKTGDEGIDVMRLQTRLRGLGCLAASVDGSYGGTTARAVRIFQHYNGLSETGVADEATQRLIYSANAQKPAYAILSPGSSGDAVKQLQTRLKILGFTNANPDGSYGDKTKTAIETLQTYMRDREIAVLKNYYGADQDISDKISIEVNGVADSLLLEEFYSDQFPSIPQQLQNGSSCDDVVRVQRRLSGLDFYEGTLDGAYGSGTQSAVTAFQKRHKLPQTGVADARTLSVLFSADAQKALKPYQVKVSTDKQRVYVYGLDDDNEYTVLVREMKCSTGKNDTPTPKGTYTSTTGPGARWHYFEKFDCWAQYAYYIQGDIMFHSVLYGEKEGRVTKSSVNNLGRKASHGCVRLAVEDAEWIYKNCPRGTTVIVY